MVENWLCVHVCLCVCVCMRMRMCAYMHMCLCVFNKSPTSFDGFMKQAFPSIVLAVDISVVLQQCLGNSLLHSPQCQVKRYVSFVVHFVHLVLQLQVLSSESDSE